MSILIEVCVDSLEGARTAQAQGADRLELCANLPIGGTTPSAGLLRLVRQESRLPIHVLVRARGGDFLYTETEVETMLADIRLAKNEGADGIVCGALSARGRVDEALTQRIIEAAAPLPFTFHRAFDECADAFEALRVLRELGAARVLTSGLAPDVHAGIPLLKKLWAQADGIEIMPGGGITPENITEILSSLPLREIHFSGSVRVPSGMTYQRTGAPPLLVTDAKRLGQMIETVRASEKF
ncbi:MAG: copper homeostasis protein CutC [Anaerolineaceae bacterium]|nr:copper homeostasis protein CutC [Anaerolineaceae bacterium]